MMQATKTIAMSMAAASVFYAVAPTSTTASSQPAIVVDLVNQPRPVVLAVRQVEKQLGYVITYEELLRRGRITGEFYRNPLQSLAFVAVVYVVVNFALSTTARRLEDRQRRKYRAGEIRVAGVEELA